MDYRIVETSSGVYIQKLVSVRCGFLFMDRRMEWKFIVGMLWGSMDTAPENFVYVKDAKEEVKRLTKRDKEMERGTIIYGVK